MPEWGHGKYGPTGGELIAAAFDQYAEGKFFRSDPMSPRGFRARLRYLQEHRGGMDLLQQHGVKARPRSVRAWLAGAVAPRRSTREAVDAAYRQLRRHNIARALRRRLADGRRITVEALPPDAVPVHQQTRQQQFDDREAYVSGATWARFVDAWEYQDWGGMDDLWMDVCDDLGSPPEGYYEVSHVGFTI